METHSPITYKVCGMTHEKEEKCSCPFRDECFPNESNQKSDLESHLNPLVYEPLYNCPTEEYPFRTGDLSSLIRHCRMTHGYQPAVSAALMDDITTFATHLTEYVTEYPPADAEQPAALEYIPPLMSSGLEVVTPSVTLTAEPLELLVPEQWGDDTLASASQPVSDTTGIHSVPGFEWLSSQDAPAHNSPSLPLVTVPYEIDNTSLHTSTSFYSAPFNSNTCMSRLLSLVASPTFNNAPRFVMEEITSTDAVLYDIDYAPSFYSIDAHTPAHFPPSVLSDTLYDTPSAFWTHPISVVQPFANNTPFADQHDENDAVASLEALAFDIALRVLTEADEDYAPIPTSFYPASFNFDTCTSRCLSLVPSYTFDNALSPSSSVMQQMTPTDAVLYDVDDADTLYDAPPPTPVFWTQPIPVVQPSADNTSFAYRYNGHDVVVPPETLADYVRSAALGVVVTRALEEYADSLGYYGDVEQNVPDDSYDATTDTDDDDAERDMDCSTEWLYV